MLHLFIYFKRHLWCSRQIYVRTHGKTEHSSFLHTTKTIPACGVVVKIIRSTEVSFRYENKLSLSLAIAIKQLMRVNKCHKHFQTSFVRTSGEWRSKWMNERTNERTERQCKRKQQLVRSVWARGILAAIVCMYLNFYTNKQEIIEKKIKVMVVNFENKIKNKKEYSTYLCSPIKVTHHSVHTKCRTEKTCSVHMRKKRKSSYRALDSFIISTFKWLPTAKGSRRFLSPNIHVILLEFASIQVYQVSGMRSDLIADRVFVVVVADKSNQRKTELE